MAKAKTPLILEKIEVLGMAAEGKCVAKPDGKVVFLKDSAPGDVVDIRITRKKKASWKAILSSTTPDQQ